MSIFVDASAIVAITMEEAGFEPLAERLARAGAGVTSPIAIYESVTAIARIKAMEPALVLGELLASLQTVRIEIRELPVETGQLAVDAFARFGKGRHPAALNMGDCFAYAAARRLDLPLLYKGEDFALTDIPSALEAC